MKILFVGNMNDYTETYSKYAALKNLGHEVKSVTTKTIPFYPGITPDKSFLERILNRFNIFSDKLGVNKKIMELTLSHEFDLVWSDKALIINQKTLLWIKKHRPMIKLIFASGDNMMVKNFTGGYWEKIYKLFDFHITTKSHIIDKLKNIGCKRVLYSPKSYDKSWMFPKEQIEYKYEVAFIGSYEKERAESILYLAKCGIQVNVWGNGWKHIQSTRNLKIHDKPLYKDAMVEVICMSKINLCFLRKLAGDRHTNRTFEIPAIGGFMLGERTNEHLTFFTEGLEAEYFSDNEELLRKVKYYLRNIDKLQKIAKNGRKKCLSQEYTFEDRMSEILKKIL